MKFFGNGIVWDKENDRSLCKFENGEVEVIDTRTAEILTGLGYKSDGLGVLADNEIEIPTEIKEKQPETVKGVENIGNSKDNANIRKR